MRVTVVATDMRSRITGWRAARLPYCANRDRRGCFDSRTGGSVVLIESQYENLYIATMKKRPYPRNRYRRYQIIEAGLSTTLPTNTMAAVTIAIASGC